MYDIGQELFAQSERYIYGASYRTSYHRVVTDTEEAHHFHMSRYGRRTCELSIAVHTAQRIRHTVRSRTGCHIIRVQGTSCTTTTGY